MKTFAVTALLVVWVTMTSSAPAEKQKRSADSPCTVNGEEYAHDSTFSLPGSPCITYRCTDGSITMESGGCQDANGVCRDVGEVWPAGTCSTYKCHSETVDGMTYYKTKLDTVRCAANGGNCYDLGQTWTNGCFTYQCTSEVKDGKTYISNALVDGGCQDSSGGCRDVGETWQVPGSCVSYKCVLNGNSYQTTFDSLGCMGSDGQCHAVGSDWTRDCRTYTCSSEVKDDGKTYLSVSNTSTKCKDADGVCRSTEETFPLVIGGTRYESCTCTVTGQNTAYQCSG